MASHSNTARDVRQACVLLSSPLPKGKHAAKHNAEPAPLMMEHTSLRSATTRHRPLQCNLQNVEVPRASQKGSSGSAHRSGGAV